MLKGNNKMRREKAIEVLQGMRTFLYTGNKSAFIVKYKPVYVDGTLHYCSKHGFYHLHVWFTFENRDTQQERWILTYR